MTLTLRRYAAWIACCAMLFAALAPSMSRAFAASGGDWTEICSVNGSKLVKLASVQSGADKLASGAASHVEHCPFCATHGGSFALLPGAAFVLPVLATQNFRPSLFYQAPRPLPIWTAAQSRAPPVLA
ncbi:MAG: DUF2946 domain-containing protein [Pseudomonadota bacterium]